MNRARTLTTLMTGTAAAAVAASVITSVTAADAGVAGVTARNTAPATAAQNPSAVGLSRDGRLVTFKVQAANQAKRTGKVTGLTDDTRLVGIDYRPATGRLYGVGDSGGIYTLNPTTAKATKVSQLTVPLTGSQFGVDFNPAVDRLRIVSNTGQNLRHDVSTGGTTVVDTDLNNGATPPATVNGIAGAAYTNNDNFARTGTLLYDVNTAADTIVVQVPANAGTLSPIGPLTFDARVDAGFDVYSAVDSSGRSIGNTAYATLRTKQGALKLYTVNLTTGRATVKKAFPGSFAVVDLAVKPAAKPVPTPTGSATPTATPTVTPTGTPTGSPTLPTLLPSSSTTPTPTSPTTAAP